MSYGDTAREDYSTEADAGVALRRSRRDQDSSGAAVLLDRLEKALHGTDDALGGLTERLAPILAPEPPTALDSSARDEPRSELSARLDHMCEQAERQRNFLRVLTGRIDL